MILKIDSQKAVFEARFAKKAQQNETLHPMGTTHIPIDQGIP